MVQSWNQCLLLLVVINTDKVFTLPLGVMQFQGQYGNDTAMVMAFVVLAMVPRGAVLSVRRTVPGCWTDGGRDQ